MISRRKFASIARQVTSWWATFFICLAFTLIMVYRCVIPLNALPYTEGIKGQDCGQMAWNLWIVNESITNGRNPYFTNLIFYPIGSGLAYHTLAAGFFPVTFLVKEVLRSNPLYPIYTYRIIILISFTLVLFSSYLLLTELDFRGWAAWIPAIAYAFCGFYMLHVLHLNHIAGFFIPMTALFLLRAYRIPTPSRTLTAALVATAAVYFTELALSIYMALAMFMALMFAFSHTRVELMTVLGSIGAKQLLVCIVTGAFIAAPFLANVSVTQVLTPVPAESSYYSANVAGFFVPMDTEARLYRGIFRPLSKHLTAGMGEAGVFIGFPMLMLSLVGLIRSPKKELLICGLLSAMFFLLSLGPTLKVFDDDTGLVMPYRLLMDLPPFNNSRAPVRFVVIAIFFMMILAAAGINRLYKAGSKFLGQRWSTVGMFLLLVWTVAEAYSPCPLQKPFTIPPALSNVIPGPALNLPLNRNDGYASLLQTFHHQPIGTGYVARYSRDQWHQFSKLERLYRKGGADFCTGITEMGFRNIVIAPDDVASRAAGVASLDLSRCSLNVVDLRSATGHLSGPEHPKAFPLYTPGIQLDLRSHKADDFLWYGWSGPEPEFRWTDGTSAAIVFSLDRSRPLLLRMRLSPFLVPGRLNTQHLEIELNGHALTPLQLTGPEPREYTIAVPFTDLQSLNTLHFKMPDAESPAFLGTGGDERLLGVDVEWLELDEVGSDGLSVK